jgi:sulfatase modifying factor 1
MKYFRVLAAASTLTLFACNTNKLYEAPTASPFKGGTLPAPPGMVYVPSGTILYKSSLDSNDVGRNVSLSAFFIDETEVTNRQYRAFVNWVADSIAVTDYLNDDQYFLEDMGDDTPRQINWSRVKKASPLWKSKDQSIQERLAPMLTMEGTRRVLNPEVVKYRFSYLKANNGQGGPVHVVDTVAVMPVEDIWSKDFPNAQLMFMDANYFNHESYDNHPVVGVTWRQARAYTDWRGKEMMASIMKNSYLSGFQLTFSLPTEAQWQYAAEGKIDPRDTTVQTRMTIDAPGGDQKRLAVNFKQGEGTYSRDGATFTLPVKSYTPNAFGIYNMAGNVAEWTLDAFSPSAIEFVNDLNPVLLYDADEDDSDALKRKVVRGGSWKDNGELLNSETRSYELQNAPHSYIGFRCVIPAFEMTTEQSKTRKFR